MPQLNNTSAAQGQQYKRLPSRLFVALFFFLPLVGWGQDLPFEVTTAEDVTNHNEKCYWIESVGATGFYAVPHSDNAYASTTNAPTLRALWYFMESGESGYYYIINKETGKYLKKTGNVGADNTIGVATYASADDDKFKFSFDTPQGIAEGSWVVYPKEAGTEGWLSKKSGNIQYGLWLKVSNWNSTPVGDLNSQWKIVARADVQWPKSGLPFVVSTSSDKHYYRINHAQNTSFNISYDGSNFATISNAYDNKTAWYFEEAASDPDINNLKYYYIVNASSEKYLKFTATTINGSNQNDKFILSDYVAGDEDRFQFVVVNSFGGNAGYSIMPKLAMSKYDENNYANSMVPGSVTNNEKLDLRSDRNNSNAHWNFVPTEYPMSCAITSITYSSETGKITITSVPAGTVIHYTTDGVTVPSSTVGTLYSEPFAVSSLMTIMAIATKTGYDPSGVETVSFDQVATPGFELTDDAKVRLTCATSGASIYYAMGTTQPTSVTIDPSNLYSGPIENAAGKYITAIAVKDGLWINSTPLETGQITFPCAKPVIRKTSATTFTITCSYPTSGVTIYYNTGDGNQADPTSASTEYIGEVTFNESDLPFTVKAIAMASGYDNSEVATKTIREELTPDGEGNYHITNQTEFETFVDMANDTDGASHHYILEYDVTAVAEIAEPFTGTFDGNYHTITGLSNPLFNTVDGGVVKNVMLKEVDISSSADTVGAITNIAKGYSRIYNCGILPNNANFPEGTHPSVATSGNCAGGLVGSLRDDSRVVNCFSYADVQASNLAAGIVGRNTFASDASETDGKYANLRTMVVNCMFYSNITASSVYPVYGGLKISNTGADAINNYNFYSVGCTFTGTFADYNCSWPAQLEYLTRYEFHRNLLNSNRELCGWWVGAPSAPSTMDTIDVQNVPKDASLIAKWVLDPSIAPYPILKPFGKYSSPVNIDADASWRETANKWEGKKLGTLNVTVNPGNQAPNGISSIVYDGTNNHPAFVITDMDTIHGDYCYRKIQLPYYNTVFGNPDGDTWDEKYGGNYKDYVVIGWKVSTTEGTEGTLTEDWETGYNFADRNCTAKDANRVFAQGGYYYVPNGVKNITITAQWAQAVYFDNTDHSYDRVNMSGAKPGTHFAPAGTRPTTLGNGKTVLTNNLKELANTAAYIGDNVYDYAVVLVGNHQYRHHEGNNGEDIGSSSSKKGFTVISSDFDFDEEPDHCLIWQLGKKYGRQSFCPIRFDFLPVVEIGLAMKEDGSTQYYSLGCYRPLGHFEVTETSLIHFGQFEFSNKDRSLYAPLILNGGIFDQYTKGTNGNAMGNANDKINYIIIGGNVRMPSFTPGAHVNANANKPTRHCAVNVIGGSIDNLYLTGNYNNEVTPNADNPHCYIDGGRIKHVAAAGKEGINGDVYFKINHSKIWEFYGGSTMDQSSGDNFKTVKGNIDVTIDSSIVVKYCGGPKFGDMVYDEANPANSKTITTRATGTTFTYYYGGGNGGTSYVQYDKTDVTGDYGVSTGTYNWNGTGNNQGHLNSYTPAAYRSGDNNYKADYDMEIVNTSAGTESGEAVCRTYFYAAQFSATNTGPISNTLTGCKVLKNFYGAGNLGGVYGDVTSELTDTKVDSLAFGAGFSASIPQVTIHNRDKTHPTIDIHTGIITPQSGGTSTTYTWTNETSLGGTSLSTNSPAVLNPNGDGINYFFTTISLQNLGTVSGNVTLTIKGSSVIGTEGEANTGNVYGGGDQSAVTHNTTVKLQGSAHVLGNVYGGGNRGHVTGDSSVTIEAEPSVTPEP